MTGATTSTAAAPSTSAHGGFVAERLDRKTAECIASGALDTVAAVLADQAPASGGLVDEPLVDAALAEGFVTAAMECVEQPSTFTPSE